MLDDVRPQGRPCLMFSLDYGEIYEGEKNVELCSGFCCVFNEEASRKFVREWRAKVDATELSWDQLQVNQIYGKWTASQKIRTLVELDYEDYQRCLRGKETWDVPLIWHPRCPVDPSTSRPYDASRRAAALTYVAQQLVKGRAGVLRCFHLLLEGGEDFASRKAMHLESTSGVLPTLTPEFAMDPRTGRPRFRLRSSVKVPGPKKGPLVDQSGELPCGNQICRRRVDGERAVEISWPHRQTHRQGEFYGCGVGCVAAHAFSGEARRQGARAARQACSTRRAKERGHPVEAVVICMLSVTPVTPDYD